MKRLLQAAPAARMLLIASICLGLAGGVLIILEASWLARITDRAFLRGETLAALLPAMGVLLTWIVLRVLVQIVSDLASLRFAADVKNDLRKMVVRKLAELGPAYAKKERSGEILSTLYEGIEQLETYLARYLPTMALSTLLPVAVLCAVARLDWTTTIVLAITFPFLILFMILIGKTAQAKTERQYKALGLLSGHFFDVLRGLPTLKIFNRSREQLAVIERISERHRKTTMGTLRLAFLSALVMELFSTLGTAVVAVFLGLRLVSGDIAFYNAYAALLLTPEFYLPVRALGTQFHSGMNGRIAAERILGILEAEPPGWTERDGAITLPKPVATEAGGAGSYSIAFDRVGFRYPDVAADALEDVTFTVEAGKRIAVIGHTGAGKSTLLDLLQGFIKPTEGSICIDGADISQLSINWWRKQTAIVAQQVHLFQGTVLDNLRLGKPDASMEEIVAAARRAQADEFINQLPGGYATRIGEAVRFSGGQMQRIAIARAILKDAPVLLLDEPTARLDMENEAKVQAAWDEVCRGRTVIMAAHRLDTVRSADYMIVLESGRIIEAGKPEELLEQDGVYAAMMRAYEEAAAAPEDLGTGAVEGADRSAWQTIAEEETAAVEPMSASDRRAVEKDQDSVSRKPGEGVLAQLEEVKG